jgi:predicted Abi (CAAX) family protease
MGLIVRSAIGLSLLFLVLPLDVSEQTAGQEQVGPVQALFAARDAVRDVVGICERQPDVCATAHAAFATIMAKARESVRLAQALTAEPATHAGPIEPVPATETPAPAPLDR